MSDTEDDNKPLLQNVDDVDFDQRDSSSGSDSSDIQQPAQVASSSKLPTVTSKSSRPMTVASLAEQERGGRATVRRDDARQMAAARREREQQAYQEETVGICLFF